MKEVEYSLGGGGMKGFKSEEKDVFEVERLDLESEGVCFEDKHWQ